MFGLFKYVGDAITGRSRIIRQARNDAETQARFEDVVEASLPLMRALRRLAQNPSHRFRFIARQEGSVLRIGTNIKIITSNASAPVFVGLSVGAMADKEGNMRPHILLHKPDGDSMLDPTRFGDMRYVIEVVRLLADAKYRLGHIWGPMPKPEFPRGIPSMGPWLLLRK